MRPIIMRTGARKDGKAVEDGTDRSATQEWVEIVIGGVNIEKYRPSMTIRVAVKCRLLVSWHAIYIKFDDLNYKRSENL